VPSPSWFPSRDVLSRGWILNANTSARLRPALRRHRLKVLSRPRSPSREQVYGCLGPFRGHSSPFWQSSHCCTIQPQPPRKSSRLVGLRRSLLEGAIRRMLNYLTACGSSEHLLLRTNRFPAS